MSNGTHIYTYIALRQVPLVQTASLTFLTVFHIAITLYVKTPKSYIEKCNFPIFEKMILYIIIHT